MAVDLTDRVRVGGEQGLLGLVLHPLWPDVPRAFIHYSDEAGDTVLAELAGAQPEGGPPTFDASSQRVMLRVDQPYDNHNGGQLAFGPDGYLYFGLGDGGSRAATRTGTGRIRRRSSGRSSGSTSRATRTGSPPTTPSPTAMAARRRCTSTACATRGASASTA